MNRSAWLVLLLGVASCGGESIDPTDPRRAARVAEREFAGVCVTCHGASGAGDGPAGRALKPRPRDWTDGAWHATVTDEHIANVIREGGAAHGLSGVMPPLRQGLRADDEVVRELVRIVRGFRD